MEQTKCSICPDKIAVNESVNNPGTFYCSNCANYVAMEYGITYLKPLKENKIMEEQYGQSVPQVMAEIKESIETSPLADKKIFFFDTETSGFINKKIPADHPEQAWCIQVGGILTDGLEEDIEILNILIKPEGRTMHPMALATHGIELDYAQENGILELEAANLFGTILRKADLIVCHNYDFDWTHVKAMLERNMDNLSDEARSAFYLDIPFVCTMKTKEVIKFCGLKNKAGRPKWPKLVEMHEILFDCPFEGQHDAMSDILATKKCFFELVKNGVLTVVF